MDLDAATTIDPETGETLRRDTRPFTLRYREQEVTVDLPGWYPAGDGESVHSGMDRKVSNRALNLMKAREAGLLTPDEIKAIRKRLALSQVEAGLILGGGARAYQRYESGDLLLSKSADSVLRILALNPVSLQELRSHRSRFNENTTEDAGELVHA